MSKTPTKTICPPGAPRPSSAEIRVLAGGRCGRIVAVEKDEITADVAAGLVAAQFPQWAALPVTPVAVNGQDNTTFRLGDELSIRLPTASCVAQVAKEHRWLPVLARQLPLPVPEPVAMGRPGDGFPRPWSVYRWIAGQTASTGQVADLTGFAAALAGFLVALQAIDTSDGPSAGAHNFFRGGPLASWDEQVRQLIGLAADDIDARAATSVWDTAVASPREQAPVWVHGDLAASNVLVADGAVRAVIDFGGVAIGDPAYDLVMAWEFFAGDSAAAFRRGLHLDEATWDRGRGWALCKALVSLGQEREGGNNAPAPVVDDPFGWRHSPRQVIGRVIADHVRSAGRGAQHRHSATSPARLGRRGGGEGVPAAAPSWEEPE
jgi:aminoglycoside phosphotransferase (APT) family kinase protein